MKKTRGYRDFLEDYDDLRKKPLKKPARHNIKVKLEHALEKNDWDSIEDEQSRNYRR